MGADEQGAEASDGRWLTIPRALCFVLNGDDVLLMKRAPHRRVFPDRYNGVGGHIERDEDPLSAIRREVEEETGLNIEDTQLRAVYNIDAGGESGILMFVFTARSARREVITNSEGTLRWIPRGDILQFDLVEDLPAMLPRILAMQPGDPPLFVHASYDAEDRLQLRLAEV